MALESKVKSRNHRDPNQRWDRNKSILIAILYLLAYLGLASSTGRAAYDSAPWYLPAGLTMALLLAGGLRYLPVALAAALLTDLVWYQPPSAPPWTVVLNAATATAGYGLSTAWLLHGAKVSRKLLTLRDVAWFTLSIPVISLLVTMLTVAGSMLIGTQARQSYVSLRLAAWAKELIGIMTLTPFLLNCLLPYSQQAIQCLFPRASKHKIASRPQPVFQDLLEITSEVVSIVVVLWFTFSSGYSGQLHLGYLCFIPLLWLALHYGLPRVSVSIVLINVGIGIAASRYSHILHSRTELQILTLALAYTGLFVGAVVRSRKRAQQEVQISQERTQRQAQELAMLNHATRMFSTSLDTDRVLTIVLEEARKQLGAITCSIWLRSPENDVLICKEATGPRSDLVRGWRLKLGQGLVGWVAESRERLITEDAISDPRHYTGVDEETGLVLRSMLTVPLEVKQEVIGVLQLADERVGRFDTTELKLLESLAASAAIAIENATLYEQAQQEIIEREQTEQALRESEDRFRRMANTAPVMIWMSEAQGNCTYFNQPWLDFRGRSMEEEWDDGWVEGVHPDDLQHCLGTYHAALETRTPFSMEYRLKNAEGEYRWIFDKGTPRFQENGQFVGFIGACTDVTALKTTEQALRETERNLSIILNSTAELFAYYNTELQVQWANRAAGASVGESAEALVGRYCYEIWQQRRAPCESCPIQRARETGTPQEGEITTPDGKIWHVRGYPVFEKGEMVGLVEFAQEITERKRAAAQIKHEAQRASALLRIAGHLNRILALDDLLQVICEENARALNVPGASVLLYLPSKKRFTLKKHIGLPDAFEQAYESPDRSAYEQFRRPDGVVVVPDAASTPELPNYEHHRQHNVRSVVGTPIVYEDELLGMLVVNTFEEVRTFTEDELVLLRGIADQAAQAITNARLFEQVRTGQQRLEQLSKRLVNAQETERRHLARELHDEIGQALTVLKINIQAIQHTSDTTAIQQHLESSLDLVEQTLEQVRDLSLTLRPSLLDDLGLVPALRWFVDHQAQQADFAAHFTADNVGKSLPPDLEIAYFRIVQEAMTNVMRHAKAQHVHVSLRKRADVLQMTIQDDGVGFDIDEALHGISRGATSMGLLNIQERAQITGSRLEISSAPGEGTTICVVTDLDGVNGGADVPASGV